LVGITLVAAGLRVIGLGDLPAGLFCDEAALGYNAHSILHSGRDEHGLVLPLYVWSFGVSYKNPIFIYTATLPIALFGLSEFSVRLTAALFGVLGVLGIGLLGRAVYGGAGGLVAALLLALVPWHVHFSRIAFELIAFPTVFLFATAALVAGVRGRPYWLLIAGPLFAFCLYTYGPAKLFVPLFLLGALVVYARRLWAVRRMAALAVLLMVVTGLPVALFDVAHGERSRHYFRNTTILDSSASLADNARRVGEQYGRFFSNSFLFTYGDPLTRHAVPGFGELYRAMLPLLALGVLWCLWPAHPEGKLFLWWLVLYPIAPALMNEAPSASRGIIGVAGFCLVAAAGAILVLDVLMRVAPGPRTRRVLQGVALFALFAALGLEGWRYARAYVTTYPAVAADDFQYGYREAIEFMEARRGQYDLFLLTANRVNMPQVFTAFYNADRAPRAGRELDYLILRPDEFDRYVMEQRILAAVREDDLRFFDEYNELHRVRQPGGQTEYVIAELRSRKRYLRDWLVLGPFDNQRSAGLTRAFLDPRQLPQSDVAGVWGTVQWQPVRPQFVDVDLNGAFRAAAEAAGKPLEWLCAYATTRVVAPTARHAVLEIDARGQPLQAWINGQPVTQQPVRAAGRLRWPVQLQQGENQLVLKLCKGGGEWQFSARLTDDQGRDLRDLAVRDVLPPAPAEASASQAPPPGAAGGADADQATVPR
jgi:4-amino-4-deoxy-L-arabinose transferase-like glycosyltransferase